MIHDAGTESRFEEPTLGEGIKLGASVSSSQFLVDALCRLQDKKIGLQTLVLPFASMEDRRVLTYGSSIMGEPTGKSGIRLVPGMQARNMANIVKREGMEDEAPHSVGIVFAEDDGKTVVTADFFEAEISIKEKQIWFGRNILANCSPEMEKDCESHLQSSGQALDTPEEVVLESLLKAGNYQVVCSCIGAKASSGVYELSKYKYVIDYIVKKFDAIMNKFEFASSKSLNPFLAQYFAALVPADSSTASAEYGFVFIPHREQSKERSYAKLLLADYRADLLAYHSILRAAVSRMKREAAETSAQLGLRELRDRDSSSIEVIEQDIEYMRISNFAVD